ncbi:hypothetical protein CFC21_099020, partial [Triticum aestivum]
MGPPRGASRATLALLLLLALSAALAPGPRGRHGRLRGAPQVPAPRRERASTWRASGSTTRAATAAPSPPPSTCPSAATASPPRPGSTSRRLGSARRPRATTCRWTPAATY